MKPIIIDNFLPAQEFASLQKNRKEKFKFLYDPCIF